MTLDEIKRGEGYELEFKLVPNEDRIKTPRAGTNLPALLHLDAASAARSANGRLSRG